MDDWVVLLRRTLEIMDAAPPGTIPDDWTVGGGTMLFRRCGHRLSRDIDIFLSSPQSLTALSPRLNDEAARWIEQTAAWLRDRLPAIALRLDTAREALRLSFAGIAALAFRLSYDQAEHTVRAFLARAKT